MSDDPTPPTRKFYPPRLTPTGTVEEDVRCSQCGYNVRGLSHDGKCPECGHLIAESFIRHRTENQFQRRVDKIRQEVVDGVNKAISKPPAPAQINNYVF